MGNKITRRCASVDERYTRPQGLYPQRDVDQKKLRRLILDSKLAPCFPGEEGTSADVEECPICFLCYPSLNRSKCCSQGVCTECFLQIKSPRAARSAQCPFCKSHNYAVEYRGSKTLEEKGIEAAEEQKFIEAKIRMRKRELLEDKEREQRMKEVEGRATPPMLDEAAPVDASCLVEAAESLSSELDQEDLSNDASDSTSSDETESSGVCEELGSEGSLEPSPAPSLSTAPSAPFSSAMESATPQQHPGPAPTPGYTRYRNDDFDFDLEDIMVMEAIWQSIQDQGACNRYTLSELPQMQAPNQLADLSTDQFQEDAGVGAAAAARAESQPPEFGSGGVERLHEYSGRLAGGLASAIAAMAERHAIKGDAAQHGAKQTSSTTTTSSEPERPGDGTVGENLSSAVGESDLHAMAVTLAESGSESGLVSSSSGAGDGGCCCNDQISAQQSGDGASSSAPNGDAAVSLSLMTSTPVVAAMILPRCATTDADGKVMLPKSFEEQMMLAMALSLADAQSRARLEDSHPRLIL